MAFVLLGVGGPALGVVHRLAGEPVALGRDSDNSLSPRDPVLSRHHFVLELLNGDWSIRDLGSSNGTFVNGDRVSQRRLASDDEIRAGSCRFLFLDDSLVSAGPQYTRIADTTPATETLRIDIESCSPLDPVILHKRLHEDECNRAELAALLELASSLPGSADSGFARRRFLETIFRVVPAAKAVLVVLDPATGVPGPPHGWSSDCGPAPPFPLPEPYLTQALEQGSAISLALEGGQSTLQIVPLRCDAGISGFLALEGRPGGPVFESRHLEWLCAAARLAAGPLSSLAQIDRLRRENRLLSEELDSSRVILGESAAILALKAQIFKAAPSDATVLITGETGSGKEQVARAIHAASRRAKGPFIAVNCATLSPTLLESDLFGHERGAFTGAVSLKHGKIEAAAGGTLFLDEIGEMDPGIQARVLRVLQEREFERVGATSMLRADIRLVAATNRNLAAEVDLGRFRRDLFYRINVITVHVPPLRDRREDIPLLASHFLTEFAHAGARLIHGISAGARRRLIAHDWPGNVRELRNAIERAVVLGNSSLIEPEDLPESILESDLPEAGPESSFHKGVREAKRRLIIEALSETGGSQIEASRLLGLNPSHLSRLIRSLGLRPEAGSMK
ncbi:MAG: sigma 54-interacting transcriptional regulator [Acidobacteriota bacterium]